MPYPCVLKFGVTRFSESRIIPVNTVFIWLIDLDSPASNITSSFQWTYIVTMTGASSSLPSDCWRPLPGLGLVFFDFDEVIQIEVIYLLLVDWSARDIDKFVEDEVCEIKEWLPIERQSAIFNKFLSGFEDEDRET